MNTLLRILLCSIALVAMCCSIAWSDSSNQQDKTGEIYEAKLTLNGWKAIYEVRQRDLTIPGLIFINLSELPPSPVNYPAELTETPRNAVRGLNGETIGYAGMEDIIVVGKAELFENVRRDYSYRIDQLKDSVKVGVIHPNVVNTAVAKRDAFIALLSAGDARYRKLETSFLNKLKLNMTKMKQHIRKLENELAKMKKSDKLPEKVTSRRAAAGQIRIIEATYGANCKGFKTWDGRANTVSNGNATGQIAGLCNGKPACTYTVDYRQLGDPAYGCEKEYTVTYECKADGGSSTQSVSPEAGRGDKSVTLSCQ